MHRGAWAARCTSNSVICVTNGSKTCVGAVRALSDPRTADGGTPDDRTSAGGTPGMCASATMALFRCQSSTWFHRRVRLQLGSSAADGRRCSAWPPPSCNLSLHGAHGTADGMRPGPGMPSVALTRDVDACSPRLAFLQVKLCSDKTCSADMTDLKQVRCKRLLARSVLERPGGVASKLPEQRRPSQ